MKKELPEWAELFITVIITMTVVVLFQHFVISWGKIVSSSMEPTLMTGDITLVNRLAYVIETPQRGDIVMFQHDLGNGNGVQIFVKRIIGIPDDTISFQGGNVYINGQIYNEIYIPKSVETNCPDTFTVPKGCYFMLGDSREYSVDSRFWIDPYVDEEEILGLVFVNIPVANIIKTIQKW